MSLGSTPYPSVPHTELIEFLRRGGRMDKPECCSLDIYSLMIECWFLDPLERPTFEEIVEVLERIIESSTDKEYLDLELRQLDTPPSSEDDDSDFDGCDDSLFYGKHLL